MKHMNQVTMAPRTESDSMRDILDWSKARPAWQRDALRRLITQGEPTDTDIDELTAICKDDRLPIEPLSEHHISGHFAGAPTVSLKKISGVQNVNALVENQSLTFIPKGVNIIYGDNGSGKSGYARILKRTCRSRTVRGYESPILPNIYDESPGPQSAEIEYLAGGQHQKAEWKGDEQCDELLSEISVFDSSTANVHVGDKNDLAYTPYPLRILERLANACGAVKSKIEAEISAIEARTPQSLSNLNCSPDTRTGALLHALGKSTDPDTVRSLSELAKEEYVRLAGLESDFAQDPKAATRKLAAQNQRLESLVSKLNALEKAISRESIRKLEVLTGDLETKRAAARIASLDLSKDEPLNGVGSNAWKVLWEAARDYSTSEAYPDLGFPVTGGNARCVLCHQQLDEEASQRLRRFETFVRDKTQREEADARTALSSYRDQLKGNITSFQDFGQARLFLSDELGHIELAAIFRRFWILGRWRLRAILRKGDSEGVPFPRASDVGLRNIIANNEQRASVLIADDESDERKILRKELEELRDRKLLATIKDDVLAQISRAKSIASLQSALKDASANTITTKNTSLSRDLVSDRLSAQFLREIDSFNLASLAIELSQVTSSYGVSRFQIRLIQNKRQKATDVLSEGEHRCVALAGFMTELATNDSQSGIIFDDPVSSLDHLHREAIAKRLAEEGRKRQVIVFTHDLPFLFLLNRACTQVEDPSQKTEVALRHIQKRQGQPGYCSNHAPDKAQDATSRLRSLRAHLENTKIQYDRDPDGIKWLITARGLIDSLRQTWETAVEDTISPVLRTFSNKVNTRGFAKLSAITLADAAAMRLSYGECSDLLHKASDKLNPAAPAPCVIEKRMNELEQWLQEVAQRQNQINAA